MVSLDRNDEANRAFRMRLAALMDYLGLTNASLAKAIGVDSSLISRWRTGKRSIAGNPEYAALIARYLVPRIADPSDRLWLRRQIAGDLGAPEAEVEADLAHCAARWLYPGRTRLLENPLQEETTAVLALFAQQGIIGEQAGTSLRGMLSSLTSPSKQARAGTWRFCRSVGSKRTAKPSGLTPAPPPNGWNSTRCPFCRMSWRITWKR